MPQIPFILSVVTFLPLVGAGLILLARMLGKGQAAGAARWIAKGHYVKQRVFFADERTAIAAGFRPCANCLPEKYRAWKASRS